MRHLLLGSALVVLLIASCTTDDGPQTTDQQSLGYRDSIIQIAASGCAGPVTDCGGVDIRFPVFSDGDSGVADLLNRRIRAFFVDELGGGDVESTDMPDIGESARSLVNEFEEFRKKYPTSSQIWVVQGNATILNADSILCIRAETYSYLGGAHPNTQTVYDLVRISDGQRLKLSDLTADTTALLASAEKAFRKVAGMKETDSDYASQGFWFDNNVFALPSNVGLTKDSVILHYNPYEIAPYSMGAYTLTLPRKDL